MQCDAVSDLNTVLILTAACTQYLVSLGPNMCHLGSACMTAEHKIYSGVTTCPPLRSMPAHGM